MRLVTTAALLACAAPCAAQDYFTTMASAKHGHGYIPANIVAGWEQDAGFTVIAFVKDGARRNGTATAEDWKAVVTTGPRKPADDDDRDDDRYLDRRATTPQRAPQPLTLMAKSETTYSSTTCPALVPRIEALRPLTAIEFNPPLLNGNADGPNGDGREGLDLWLRVGSAELTRSAETTNSRLGAWFKDTQAALAACPPAAKAP